MLFSDYVCAARACGESRMHECRSCQRWSSQAKPRISGEWEGDCCGVFMVSRPAHAVSRACTSAYAKLTMLEHRASYGQERDAILRSVHGQAARACGESLMHRRTSQVGTSEASIFHERDEQEMDARLHNIREPAACACGLPREQASLENTDTRNVAYVEEGWRRCVAGCSWASSPRIRVRVEQASSEHSHVVSHPLWSGWRPTATQAMIRAWTNPDNLVEQAPSSRMH